MFEILVLISQNSKESFKKILWTCRQFGRPVIQLPISQLLLISYLNFSYISKKKTCSLSLSLYNFFTRVFTLLPMDEKRRMSYPLTPVMHLRRMKYPKLPYVRAIMSFWWHQRAHFSLDFFHKVDIRDNMGIQLYFFFFISYHTYKTATNLLCTRISSEYAFKTVSVIIRSVDS